METAVRIYKASKMFNINNQTYSVLDVNTIKTDYIIIGGIRYGLNVAMVQGSGIGIWEALFGQGMPTMVLGLNQLTTLFN